MAIARWHKSEYFQIIRLDIRIYFEAVTNRLLVEHKENISIYFTIVNTFVVVILYSGMFVLFYEYNDSVDLVKLSQKYIM